MFCVCCSVLNMSHFTWLISLFYPKPTLMLKSTDCTKSNYNHVSCFSHVENIHIIFSLESLAYLFYMLSFKFLYEHLSSPGIFSPICLSVPFAVEWLEEELCGECMIYFLCWNAQEGFPWQQHVSKQFVFEKYWSLLLTWSLLEHCMLSASLEINP